ncbi:hypothetical protein BD769DRAFT_1394945 [Suillus cothurnatus]|nr:hypothetical protein BD769DRAFT_1394945 [Suillus cothurnatus]
MALILYRGGEYDLDDPTKGLFKGSFLVRLQFALSSCGSWQNVNDDFKHDQFYVYIVDYFENLPTPTAKASVDALLMWWNCGIPVFIIDCPVSLSIHPCPGWGTYYSSGSSVPSGNFKSTPNENASTMFDICNKDIIAQCSKNKSLATDSTVLPGSQHTQTTRHPAARSPTWPTELCSTIQFVYY